MEWRVLVVVLLSFSIYYVSTQSVNGCSGGTTQLCTATPSNLGQVGDVAYDGSTLTTSWTQIAELYPFSYAYITGLTVGTVYEFRNCKGGIRSGDLLHALQIFDATNQVVPVVGSGIYSFTTQCDCPNRNWGPWKATQTAIYVASYVSTCAYTSTNYLVNLEVRIQPCPSCVVAPQTFNYAGAAPYTLSTTDLNGLLTPTANPTTGPYFGCTGNIVFNPSTIGCLDWELPVNVSLINPTGAAQSSCRATLTVHDTTLSVLSCPVDPQGLAFPAKSCDTTAPGSSFSASSMCNVLKTDLPFGTFTDTCQSDPRFGAVQAQTQTFSPAKYSVNLITTLASVQYGQLQQDGVTLSTTTCSNLRMSVLHIVTPNTYTTGSAFSVKRGIVYAISFVSSVEYLAQTGQILFEEEFRIVLREVNPPVGLQAEIVPINSDYILRSFHTIVSTGTFEILPSLNLRSDLYYLIIQGRYSKTYSVSNPILNISPPN